MASNTSYMRFMKLTYRYNKNHLSINIALIYIIMLGIVDHLLNVLISNPLRILLCLISIAIILVSCNFKNWLPLYNDILILGIIIVFFNNNYYIETINSFYILRYFILFSLLFIGRIIYLFPQRVLMIYTRLASLHIFATVWLAIDSRSYLNIIVKLFDYKHQVLLIQQYSHGWIAGLANHYSTNGMYLAVVLLLLISKLFYADTKNEKSKMTFIVVLAVIALLLTGKRAHFIFSCIAIFSMYYAYTSNISRGRILKILSNTMIVFVIFIIIYSLFPDLFTFINRFKDTADQGDVTLGRINTWSVAINIVRSSPIFGIGWGHFTQIAEENGVTINVHNVYLQLLCETGIVGLSVYLTWFISCLLRTSNLLLKMRKNIIESNLVDQRNITFSLGMQVFFLLYSITGNPLYDAPMYIPYFLSCSITMYYLKSEKISKRLGMTAVKSAAIQ